MDLNVEIFSCSMCGKKVPLKDLMECITCKDKDQFCEQGCSGEHYRETGHLVYSPLDPEKKRMRENAIDQAFKI